MATRVVRGKALVAKLRADPQVRDADALAAYLGRVKRLKKGGLSTKAAIKAASKAAKGAKTGAASKPSSPKSKSVDMVGGGKATYNPATKTAIIPNKAVDLSDRKRTRENIGRIEKAFPGVEKIGTSEGNAMSLERMKKSFGMATGKPEPRTGPRVTTTFGGSSRTPDPSEPAGYAARPSIFDRPGFGAKRTETEEKRGINPKNRGAFLRPGGLVEIRRPPDGEPTDRDKANIQQAYPGATKFSWNGKEHPLRKEAPGAGEKAAVERFVTVPAGGGKRLEGARDALKAIGEVHDVEGLTPIPITTKSGKRGNMGSFAYGMDGKPKYINAAAAQHPRTTVAHEIGHYLDLDGLGNKGRYDSQRFDGDTVDVVNAAERTPTTKRLNDMRKNPEKYGTVERITMGNGKTYEYDTRPSGRHLAYLATPEETFARAYAQYITAKSGDKKMKKEMDAQIKESNLSPSSYPTQWTWEEFAPIERAFDEMFKAKGWLKS